MAEGLVDSDSWQRGPGKKWRGILARRELNGGAGLPYFFIFGLKIKQNGCACGLCRLA